MKYDFDSNGFMALNIYFAFYCPEDDKFNYRVKIYKSNKQPEIFMKKDIMP